MARRERSHDEHNGDKHGREHERDRREPHEGDYAAIAAIRGERWEGSAPPTAEAFAKALAQWRRLPGAIGATASDLGTAGKDDVR